MSYEKVKSYFEQAGLGERGVVREQEGWRIEMNTAENILSKAYCAEEFKEKGHQVIDMIARQLQLSLAEGQEKTIAWLPPGEQFSFWQDDFTSGVKAEFSELMEKVFSHSINFHNRGYVGHQVAVTLPLTALTSAVIGYLNNCTTV